MGGKTDCHSPGAMNEPIHVLLGSSDITESADGPGRARRKVRATWAKPARTKVKTKFQLLPQRFYQTTAIATQPRLPWISASQRRPVAVARPIHDRASPNPYSRSSNCNDSDDSASPHDPAAAVGGESPAIWASGWNPNPMNQTLHTARDCRHTAGPRALSRSGTA